MDIVDPGSRTVWGTRRMIMNLGILAQAVDEEEEEMNLALNEEDVNLDRSPSTQAALEKRVKRLQATNPHVVEHERWLREQAMKDGTDVTKV